MLSLFWPTILLLLSGLTVFIVLVLLFFRFKVFHKILRLSKFYWLIISLSIVSIGLFVYATKPFPVHFAMPPFMHSHAPGGLPASLPLKNALEFLGQAQSFEKIDDIGRDPNDVPPPLTRTENQLVKINIETKEVISEIAEGIYFNYWTFDRSVPGPMYRILEGDTVEVSLTNHQSSLHSHNIDFHATTGPGGGAVVSTVGPGETKTFRWKALNPGIYEYHCAMPNVSTHNAHGQYGLILVEPKEKLERVDKEFYVMQGEIYTQGGLGKKGLVVFDSQGLLDGNPTYVPFNGRVETTPRMKAKVGDKVRIFIGNGGVNLISSFHVIGEIFDKVYPEGAIGSEPHKNIQTTAVLPGGASIVEFVTDVPGKYTLVDHALARMNKGTWAILEVEGDPQPEIFQAVN